MQTQLRSVHEEEYSDKSRTLGVLLNFSDDMSFKESFTYIYNHKNRMYIFFNTIIEMCDYLLYADDKTKRAYMPEDDFDTLYDADYIDGKFAEYLKWL